MGGSSKELFPDDVGRRDVTEYADNTDPNAFGEFYFEYLNRPVFDRLSDPVYFCASSRERFDDEGKGRGLAGREYVYFYDGMTESAKRAHEVYSTNVGKRKPIKIDGLGKKRMGVQCAPVKLIYVYRNGDPFHEGDTFFVKHAIKSLDVLYKLISSKIKPPGGQVHELYDQQFVKVKSLAELKNEGRYIACEGAGPTRRIAALSNFLNDKPR